MCFRLYDMKLNLDKCNFRVNGGKFLGFMVTYKVIEANFNKSRYNKDGYQTPH